MDLFSINKTHVMIAGGYAGDYTLTFDYIPGFHIDPIFVPGYGLDRVNIVIDLI